MIVWDVRKIEDFGIGVYIKGVLSNLPPELKIELLGFERHRGLLPYPFHPVKAERYSLAEHFELAFKLHNLRPCLFHSPHYVFPLLYSGRMIVTIHDTIHVLFSHLFRPGAGLYAKFMIKQALRRAERIITVSTRVKQALSEMEPSCSWKIGVIYNGIADEFFQPVEEGLVKEAASYSPYILAVGNNKPHKGFGLLKEAFKAVRQRHPSLRLLFAGWEAPPEDSIIYLGRLPLERLKAFYSKALLLVHPALYEGFGLPPFEATALGVPVISTRVGAVDELLEGCVLFVKEGDQQDLVEKILYALENIDKMKKMAEEARRRVRQLTWHRSAAAHLELYREVGCASL